MSHVCHDPRAQQEEKLASEREHMKRDQDAAMAEERARTESEFAARAGEIAQEHELLNMQLGQAEQELLSRQKQLEQELLNRSQELESVRKMVDALDNPSRHRRRLLWRRLLTSERAIISPHKPTQRKGKRD
jgi:oligoendopeptidase F